MQGSEEKRMQYPFVSVAILALKEETQAPVWGLSAMPLPPADLEKAGRLETRAMSPRHLPKDGIRKRWSVSACPLVPRAFVCFETRPSLEEREAPFQNT